MRLLRKIGRSDFVRIWLDRYEWYRKWYGGRWEFHWIDICHGAMWLPMKRPNVWPQYRQPCSHGTPIIEDWPEVEA